VRTKNRMDPDVDEHPIYAAYRDVALNLRFRSEEARALGLDGHICELRLGLMSIAQVFQVSTHNTRTHARATYTHTHTHTCLSDGDIRFESPSLSLCTCRPKAERHDTLATYNTATPRTSRLQELSDIIRN
jgi:hypothetical protein